MNGALVRSAVEAEPPQGGLVALAAVSFLILLWLLMLAWLRAGRSRRLQEHARRVARERPAPSRTDLFRGFRHEPGQTVGAAPEWIERPTTDPLDLQPGTVISQRLGDAIPGTGNLIILGPQPMDAWPGLLWFDGQAYRVHDGEAWIEVSHLAAEIKSLRLALEVKARQVADIDLERQRRALEVVAIGRALGMPEELLQWGGHPSPADQCLAFAQALRRCMLALVELEKRNHEEPAA